MAEKQKKPKSKVRKIIEWVLIGVFGAAALFVMAATIDGMVHKKDHYNQVIRFGIGTFIVKTDSMEPEIKVQDMIITKKEDVTKFDERLKKGETIDVTFFNVGVDDSDITIENEQLTDETSPVYFPMTHRLREVHVREDVKFGEGKYVFVASGINTQSLDWKMSQYQTFTENEYLGTVKVKKTWFFFPRFF